VVSRGNYRAYSPYFSAGLAQAFEGLWAGYFVDKVAVNVEDGRTVFFGMNYMLFPDFVVKGASHIDYLMKALFYSEARMTN
jgi:hypothetical protein